MHKGEPMSLDDMSFRVKADGVELSGDGPVWLSPDDMDAMGSLLTVLAMVLRNWMGAGEDQ